MGRGWQNRMGLGSHGAGRRGHQCGDLLGRGGHRHHALKLYAVSSAARRSLCLLWSFASSTYSEGTTNSVKRVPMVMPPTRTRPIEFRAAAPGPVTNVKGK